MSSDTQPTGDERTDDLHWQSHTINRWHDRSEAAWICPRKAFAEAPVVHYPSAYGDVECRYHAEGNVVFIADDRKVRTCIALTDRSESEQQYVQQQVSDHE